VTPRPGGGQTHLCSLLDKVAPEVGKRTEQVKGELAGGCAGIDCFVSFSERHFDGFANIVAPSEPTKAQPEPRKKVEPKPKVNRIN